MTILRDALCCALLLASCAKRATTHVGGTQDERVDVVSAKLEEVRSRTEPQNCKDRCSLAREACGATSDLCDIAANTKERPDFQQKCIAAQEDCARFNDRCASCGTSSERSNSTLPKGRAREI